MNPRRSLCSGLSDPPKFRAQFESQALDWFGTGLFPEGVSPIQKTVVTICGCQGYFSPGGSTGTGSIFPGPTLKSMLPFKFSRFLLAWPAPSETDCPNIAETPVVIRPQVKINENLLPAIKGHNPRSTFSGCQRMKLP